MGIVYSWTFGVLDYVSPWIINQYPTGILYNVNDNISVDILDDYSGVNLSSIDAYVDGYIVFSGPSTFYSPYNGAQSSISSTNVDGYDGYHLVIDRTSNFDFSTNYDVRIAADDNYGNSLDTTFNFTTKDATKIENVRVGQYEIVLIVTFDDYMLYDSNITKISNYTFNHEMYARYIENPILYDGYVKDVVMWVENFCGHDSFTLEVQNLLDQYGSNVSDSYDFEPFQSWADLTNYNCLVRTWHVSNFVIADSQRVYLAGEGGIDCFRKERSYDAVRWGQIFDSYGVEALFLVNYGNDYVFVDTTPPAFIYRDPAPGFWDGEGNIVFIIADTETAINITDLFIYINGVTVFDGSSGGFQNNYSGEIVLGYKSITVSIVPPIVYPEGSTVSVHVIASDLLDNTMDETYLLIIGESFGFGFNEFGTYSFGF
jgi:hypothetical protein